MAKETTAAEPKAAPKKFPIEKLAPCHRSVFGVSASTFAGATAGLSGEFTVEEMKARIKAWLNGKIGVGMEVKK